LSMEYVINEILPKTQKVKKPSNKVEQGELFSLYKLNF